MGTSRDQSLGAVILVVCLVGMVVYAWLLYVWPVITLQVTGFVAVAGVLAIGAWIGWVMATTPPPAPLESSIEPTPAVPVSSAASNAGKATTEMTREA